MGLGGSRSRYCVLAKGLIDVRCLITVYILCIGCVNGGNSAHLLNACPAQTYPELLRRSNCAGLSELVWDHMPLTVGYDRNEFDLGSTDWVNNQLGVKVLAPRMSEEADIFVIRHAFKSEQLPMEQIGQTIHYWHDDGKLHAVIMVFVGSQPLESYVLAHELGHAIGFAHDPMEERYGGSIMQPTLSNGDYYFTEGHRQLLWRTYHAKVGRVR